MNYAKSGMDYISSNREKKMNRKQTMYEDKWNDLCTWDRIRVDFPPHFHSYLELLIVKSGNCTVNVDFKDYELNDGDAVLVFPNRIHSYRSSGDHLVANLTFMLPPAYFPLFAHHFSSVLPECPVLRGFYLNSQARMHMEEAIKENKSKTTYGAASAAGHLAILLGMILPQFKLVPYTRDTSAEGRIIAYCTEHFKEPITLQTLESELHLSKYYISHLFSTKLNISFSQLIKYLRIDEACKLLKNGTSVTDAAMASGFGSIRSFNRAFAEEKGVTPSKYAKTKLE